MQLERAVHLHLVADDLQARIPEVFRFDINTELSGEVRYLPFARASQKVLVSWYEIRSFLQIDRVHPEPEEQSERVWIIVEVYIRVIIVRLQKPHIRMQVVFVETA